MIHDEKNTTKDRQSNNVLILKYVINFEISMAGSAVVSASLNLRRTTL